jgi:hypothetical protein
LYGRGRLGQTTGVEVLSWTTRIQVSSIPRSKVSWHHAPLITCACDPARSEFQAFGCSRLLAQSTPTTFIILRICIDQVLTSARHSLHTCTTKTSPNSCSLHQQTTTANKSPISSIHQGSSLITAHMSRPLLCKTMPLARFDNGKCNKGFTKLLFYCQSVHIVVVTTDVV